MPTLPKGAEGMIHFLYGENTLSRSQALKKLQQQYIGSQAQESYDGNDLTIEQLPSLLRGLTLFSTKKLIVIKHASDNKTVWTELTSYIENLDEDIELIIVETNPDKRTKTFKLLGKYAEVQEFAPFSEMQAKQWLADEVRARSVKLSPKQVDSIVERVGVDAWKLHFALEKLRPLDEITDEQLRNIIDAQPEVSVFAVLDNILSRKHSSLQEQLPTLKDSHDAYQFFGLLSQQLFLLITLSVAPHATQQVAKDLGVHPYPLQKMAPLAKKVSVEEREYITSVLSRCDDQLKRSGRDPWLVVEQGILALARRSTL